MSVKKMPLFLVAASVLSVAGCSLMKSVPTGYVYHGDAYKSATPPASTKFTALQRSTMGPEQSAQFRLAVYSLVDSLTTRAGMPPKPVYVLRPEKMTPFYSNFDNDLRESLRHVGYQLSDTPDNAYVVTYSAAVLDVAAAKDTNAPVVVSSTENNTVPNVRMAIHVHDGLGEQGKLLTQETGDFYVRGADVMTILYPIYSNVYIPPIREADVRTAPIPVKE